MSLVFQETCCSNQV